MFLVLGGRHEAIHQLAHRTRPHEPGFDATPRVQQPVGEDVSALFVSRKLYLIDRHEIDVAGERHGLGRTDPKIRATWHALFFASDQRHSVFADARADTVVHLTRQQP